MRIGINTLLFACPFRDEHTKLFPHFRRWGYDTVELAIMSPSDLDPVHVQEQLERHELVAGSVCGIFGPGRDLRGAPGEQKASILYIKGLIDQMQALGSTMLVGPMYSSVGRTADETGRARLQQRKVVMRHLRELASYASDHGCTLCVEPLNRFETDFLNTCEQAVDFVGDVDHAGVKILLDTFHMNIEEKDLGQAIRRAGSLLGHIHVSGSDRGTPGNDHINWQSLRSAVKLVNYQGDVVVESHWADVESNPWIGSIGRRIEPSREEIARKGARFLQRLLNPEVSLEFPCLSR